MDRPLLSVVMPVYNGEKTVANSIESVLNQTYDNLELIIVDDASTDKSRDIINSYSDNRVKKIFLDKNQHICVASNTGFRQAQGKYIGLIGHDDIWEAFKSEKQLAILEENEDISFCSSDMLVIDENDNILDEWEIYLHENDRIYEGISREECLFWMLTSGNHIYAPTVVIRKSCMDNVGLYRNALVQTQDYDLWLRLLTVGRVHAINEKLTRYRQFSDKTSNLSSPSVETTTRIEHEMQYSRYNVIVNMDNSLFLQVFKDYIRGRAQNDNEIMCEKACILASLENCFFTKLYIDLVENDECRIYLENECNFGLKNFYEYNKAPIKCDNVYYNLCSQQNNIIKRLQEQLI